MPKPLCLIGLLLARSLLLAATKSCEALKGEIKAKLEAAGGRRYALGVIAKGSATRAGKLVGSCDGGRNAIPNSRQ